MTQTVASLRELWNRRLLVGVVAAVAVAAGFLLAYHASFPPKSRSATVGVATTRILVDSPRSQVVDIKPRGSTTLGSRAVVLANLMVEGEVKRAIAHRAGLRPQQIASTAKSSYGEADPSSSKDYSLTTSVLTNTDQIELPIIKADTRAPTPELAVRLANAAVGGLREYLDSKAGAEGVQPGDRLRVTAFGAAQGTASLQGPGRMVAVAAAIFIFFGGCVLILVCSALAGAWRKESATSTRESGELGLVPEETLGGDFPESYLELVEPERDEPEPKDATRPTPSSVASSGPA
jgi:hypothetical protein